MEAALVEAAVIIGAVVAHFAVVAAAVVAAAVVAAAVVAAAVVAAAVVAAAVVAAAVVAAAVVAAAVVAASVVAAAVVADVQVLVKAEHVHGPHLERIIPHIPEHVLVQSAAPQAATHFARTSLQQKNPRNKAISTEKHGYYQRLIGLTLIVLGGGIRTPPCDKWLPFKFSNN